MATRKLFPASEKLVSTTDPRGTILYANKGFVDISGYSAEELTGAPHNIVRHPDMPKAAFKGLWASIKLGKPWMGMVKNRCKNGDFYWVDAYVTPVLEKGTIIGFQSVRVSPQERHVDNAEALYSKIQTPGSETRKVRGLSLKFKAGFAYLVSIVGVTLALSLPGLGTVTSAALALVSVVAGSGWLLYLWSQWNHVLQR